MTISTTVLAITGVFGVERGTGSSTPKDKRWLDRLADAPKKLAGKTFEVVKATVGSAAGAILSFLKGLLDLLVSVH